MYCLDCLETLVHIITRVFDSCSLIMNLLVWQLRGRETLEKTGRVLLVCGDLKTHRSCLLRRPAPWSLLIYAAVCSQPGTHRFNLVEWYLSTTEWENCPASESMTNSISCTMLTFNQQSQKG